MPEAKHAKPTSPFPLSNPVAEIFARSADQWFATQAALLADVDALTHAWLHRRRASVDATQQAIQQMTGCQHPGEMLHIQQEWLSGVFRRATEDIDAFNTSIASIAKRATADLERGAHEITEPIQADGQEDSKPAGARLHQHKSAA
jgi:phasin protein